MTSTASWAQAADGTGTPERVTRNAAVAYGFTPDGSKLVYRVDNAGKPGADLWLLSMDSRRSEPLLQSPFNEHHAELSADGRWLAYASDESGRSEVFVRPFPAVNGGRWQVSTAGGSHPLFARNGDELFFFSPAGEIMGVKIGKGSMWNASAPVKLVGRALPHESRRRPHL
jgi:Tol biopolymer transport system component